MWQAFSAAARQAISEGRNAHGKVLWLLADACSMRLTPESVNEPYKPFMVMGEQRSAIPDDFSDSDLAFYATMVDAVDDPWLKARLADVTWLRMRKRDVRFALVGIDSYRLITLDTETWMNESNALGKSVAHRNGTLQCAISEDLRTHPTIPVQLLPETYLRDAEPVAIRRAALAGHRLAGVLNEALGE